MDRLWRADGPDDISIMQWGLIWTLRVLFAPLYIVGSVMCIGTLLFMPILLLSVILWAVLDILGIL